MKSLFRIIRRYSLTVGVIILIILVSNGCLLTGIGYYVSKQEASERFSKISVSTMELIGDEFSERKDGNQMPLPYVLSEKGMEILEDSEFIWAMALDREGKAVWQWKLPPEIPVQYSIQDVAAFSRWYLADYPVRVLVSGELLLVFGCDPGLIFRHSLVISEPLIEFLAIYGKAAVFINLLVILLFVLGFGCRFYRSMKPIAQGIEDLAAQKPVHLKERGAVGELAGKLNEASELLLSQNKALARKDFARTEWIAGVSHDIRTPLSLIMGYSDRLARDPSLQNGNRLLAENIRRQSLIIRQLIANLNLTSKLAYQAQPLKKTRCLLVALLRSAISDIYNEELEQGGEYEFEIMMKEEMEQVWVQADEGLLMRALRNLLGNSIKHNPAGCQITVSLTRQEDCLSCFVQDTGPGIPEEVVQNMAKPDSRVHIMGLCLTDQIARAHGGSLEFQKRAEGNYDAMLLIRESL